jgi:hypothetical protein
VNHVEGVLEGVLKRESIHAHCRHDRPRVVVGVVVGDRVVITDAVSARIIRWEGNRVGVSYTYADGAREAHAVGTDDWPVIKRLKAAGKLSYVDDEVRQGMDEIVRRGLDR